jgi:hypothetical protein
VTLDDRHLSELLEATAPKPRNHIDPAVVRRKAHLRTKVNRATAAAGILILVVAGVSVVSQSPAPGPVISEVDEPLAERAPEAGLKTSHWPVELVYVRGDGQRIRFRGTSWLDWSMEGSSPETGEWHLGQRHDRDPEGAISGGSIDPSRVTGPSPELLPYWRDAVGLSERSVVPVERIPNASELVASLGLSSDEVEAYATPNVADCTDRLADCAPDELAARAIAHVETGFPLFAEERYDIRVGVDLWLRAISFSYADPTVTPASP